MKKIFFRKIFGKGWIPFWQPWGCLGCLGRLLLFLLLLFLLLLLLSLFRTCCHETIVTNPDADGTDTPGLVDKGGWHEPIEDGEDVGLPSPEENKLPPFEEKKPIPNPEDGGATEIYPDLLYVVFDSEADDETFKTFATKFSSLYPAPEHKIVYYNTGSKTAILEVPEASREKICEELPGKIPEVSFFVIPVEVMIQNAAELIPNDPAFKDAEKSWYFKPIQAQEAWAITQGSSDIIVGIVDSYMDLSHPELQGDRCVYPYSVVNDNDDVAPPPGIDAAYAGHGTMVTSIAVGNADNNAGSSGIAPHCKFIPVSIGQYLNNVTEIEGILYCIYHGASVVNISAGAAFDESITKMPIEKQIAFAQNHSKRQEKMWDFVFKLAEKHNTTIVWASGNYNCFSAMDASKRNANTIRVSAVGQDLKRANFSNFGNFETRDIHESTISAPGVYIWGALPNNSYDAWKGTSFSAPIITGVVALIKSQNKDLTTPQIVKILELSGKPVEGSPEIGNLVQIKDALLKAKAAVASGKIE